MICYVQIWKDNNPMKLIIIAAIIILLAILVCIVIYHDTHHFVVRDYTIKSNKVSKDYEFVLLSDLHGYHYGKNNQDLIDAIDRIKPDGIICSGDMFTGSKIKGKLQYETAFDLISKLSDKYRIYYGNGNHEYKVKTFTFEYGNFYDRYKSRLKRRGVIFLENDSILLDDYNIRITGLDLSLEFFRKVIKRKMEDDFLNKELGSISAREREQFQILIAHNPQYFKEYADWGADLSLSGHVHGGIVRLPILGGVISPALVLFPKYDGGEYTIDDHKMILSRGLGTHTIHVRFLNPGELCRIRVVKE